RSDDGPGALVVLQERPRPPALSPFSSHSNLLRQRRPDRPDLAADAKIDRTIERRPGDDLDAPPRRDSELSEIAQLLAVAIADALNANTLSNRDGRQRDHRLFDKRSFARRNRRTVRIGERVADCRSHA